MKDRSVEYPNRYRMTLVPGTTDIYEMTPVPGEVYEAGTLVNKANLLSDETEIALWGNAADRTVNQAIHELTMTKENPWKLIDKIDNTRGYSGEWTAPDVFGDGSPYDLGVYMIGGGGSGAAARPNTNYISSASGGASGYAKNFVMEGITPGVKYSWVIGAKGECVSITGSSGKGQNGSAGGATSFAGEVALGGFGGLFGSYQSSGQFPAGADGGQGSDIGGNIITPRDLFGCCSTTNYIANSVRSNRGGYSQSPRTGQNAFDTLMVSLCAGGGVESNKAQVITAMPDGTKGGDGAYGYDVDTTAESATGYGNGGGSTVMVIPGSKMSTMTSGAGSDGVIFLYARKAVSE